MRDLVHNLDTAVALTPATVSATGNGSIIDLAGYESVMFIVQTGALTAADADNKLAVTVQEGDKSDLADAATVDAKFILGTLPTIDNATDDASKVIGSFSYIGDKRYVRLVFTETGTFTGIVGAVAVKGNARRKQIS